MMILLPRGLKNWALLLVFIASIANAACEKPSDLDVVAWSYEAMLATHNMSYKDAKEGMAFAKSYYTKKAWSEYDEIQKNSGTIERIQENELTVMIGLQTSPIIVEKSETDWVIEMPLLVNYESTGSYNTEHENVRLAIIQNKHCALKIKKIEKS